MARYIATTISTGYGSTSLFNTNFTNIQTGLTDALSRSETSNNSMSARLDMNGYRIINLPAPTSGSDACRFSDLTASLELTGVAIPALSTGKLLTNDGVNLGWAAMGTGVLTFLETPSSANLLAAVTNETGTGALVFGTSPTLTTPILSGAVNVSAATFTGATSFTTNASGFNNNTFHLFDTNNSHTLTFNIQSDLTANRTLNILTGDAASTLDTRSVYFARHSAAATGLTNNVATKVPLATAIYDNTSGWDAGNNRFTPQVPGVYQVNAQIHTTATTDGGRVVCMIYKNGSELYHSENRGSFGGLSGASVSGIVTLNGTTDYIELFALSSAGGTTIDLASAVPTSLSAVKVSAL